MISKLLCIHSTDKHFFGSYNYHSLRAYNMPRTLLDTLPILPHLSFKTTYGLYINYVLQVKQLRL